MKVKKKGFTLIEVIAVLVIMAIIALIATPLVMNIIRKAKDSADKRSIDVYGKTVELAAVAYMLDDTEFPTSFDDLTIEYTGSKVECAVNIVNYDGSVFLDKCAVNGRLIKDSKFSSGYYQYGRDTGNYMFTLYKDINEVVNNSSNGSGSSSSGSTNSTSLSTTTSTLGTVTYNGGIYYRLTNVNVNVGYVALTPEKPLSYEDTVKYAGNIPVANVNGYGYVAYYTSDTCNASNNTDCKTDYASSNAKIIIDAWALDNLKDGSTASIMTTEYLTNQGYSLVGNNTYQKTSATPTGLFSLGIDYWAIDDNGNVYKGSSTFNVTYPYDTATIRPIIIAPKDDVKVNRPTNNGNNNGTSANSVTNNTNNDTANPYTVDNIIMFVAIAVIVICAIIYFAYIISKNKKKEEKKKENTNK